MFQLIYLYNYLLKIRTKLQVIVCGGQSGDFKPLCSPYMTGKKSGQK